MSDLTRILAQLDKGEREVASELLPIIYDELRRLASVKMAQESPGQTLQPTALVHEAWLRLGGEVQPNWQSRAHFFAAAAEAMRRILVERARRRARIKHGEGIDRVNIEEVEIALPVRDEDELLAVHEALERLAALHPPKAELVKLRYFAGMTFEEAASALGIAAPTAKEWWTHARAWLALELRQQGLR